MKDCHGAIPNPQAAPAPRSKQSELQQPAGSSPTETQMDAQVHTRSLGGTGGKWHCVCYSNLCANLRELSDQPRFPGLLFDYFVPFLLLDCLLTLTFLNLQPMTFPFPRLLITRLLMLNSSAYTFSFFFPGATNLPFLLLSAVPWCAHWVLTFLSLAIISDLLSIGSLLTPQKPLVSSIPQIITFSTRGFSSCYILVWMCLVWAIFLLYSQFILCLCHRKGFFKS